MHKIMDYDEKQFLKSIFYKKDEYTPMKEENLKALKWLNLFEKIVELAHFNKYNGKEILKHLFLQKYINYQNVSLIEEQRISLEKWLNYFLEESTQIVYPTWFLFYALMGVLQMGKYNEEHQNFSKRHLDTASPFVPLDKSALALVYQYISEYFTVSKRDCELWSYFDWFSKEKKSLNSVMDPIRTKVKEDITPFLKQGSFKELYSYFLHNKTLESEINDGKWRMDEESIWPSKEEWIYYTRDENGKFSVPRIILDVRKLEIFKIHGLNRYWDIEPLLFEVVEKRNQKYPNCKYTKKRIYDMMKMYSIYREYQKRELTNKELITLYQLREPLRAFSQEIYWGTGWHRESFGIPLDEDPEISHSVAWSQLENRLTFMLAEMRPFLASRDDMKEIVSIFRYLDKNYKKLNLNENKKVAYKSMNLSDCDLEYRIKYNILLPEVLNGSLNVEWWPNLENKTIRFPKCINGNLNLFHCRYLGNSILPEYVYGTCELNCLQEAKNVVFPKYIDDELIIEGLQNADDCIFSEYIRRDFDLTSVVSIKNTKFPNFVGGNFDMGHLTEAYDTKLPRYVGYTIDLNHLKNAKSVLFPYFVGENIELDSLEYAQDVIFSDYVGNNVLLPNLKVAIQVILPRIIKGKLDISSLYSLDGIFVLDGFECKELISPMFTMDDLLSKTLPKEQELTLIKEKKYTANESF